MPKYYFHVSDGRCSPDTDGLYLADAKAARLEADRRVAMLLRATLKAQRMPHAWRMSVKDEAGAVVFDIEATSGVHCTPGFAP